MSHINRDAGTDGRAREAGRESFLNVRNLSLLLLGALSCTLLMFAVRFCQVVDNAHLRGKNVTAVKRQIQELSFQLTVVSALQLCGIAVLLVAGQVGKCATESRILSSALDNLEISRIIRKRESLSLDELVSLLRDMGSELKQSRTMQRFLIERASHVVCTIDDSGTFVSVSRASLSAWGYVSSDLEGTAFCNYLQDGELIVDKMLSAAKSGKRVVIETKLRARDGELLDIIWTAYWSRSDNALFCVAQDVTERRRSEQLRNEFIATVTHDLKTPLSSFNGILELLGQGALGSLNPDGQRLVSNVSRDFDRIQRLISNMLDLERTESGNMPFECQQIDVDQVIGDAINMMRFQASAKNIRITYSPSQITAWADRDQLVRVVLNLLSNATKFSPDDSTVEVCVNNLGAQVRIAVVDYGRGIPQDKKDRLFSKFQQVQLSDSKRHGGTGLGLAICKAIVTKHGGEIGVRTAEGKGSEFWFTVPSEDPRFNSGVIQISYDQLQEGKLGAS